jgi:aspartate-semialdehyde dehydrogenase
MAHRTTEPATGRIAVLGAASPAGTHLRTALADRGVPGARVELFGRKRSVAVLSEYDGEARLVQAAGELDAGACQAVFVCEPGHDPGILTEAAAAGTVVIDMTGSIPDARIVSIPHPIAAMLHTLLAPVDRALGLTRVSAFITRPASDFGEPGLEELREQTVHLLRFEATPTEIFGRQLAFNVVPEHLFPGAEDRSGERIVRELKDLLGAAGLTVAVSQALVPTFFGHGVAAHLTLQRASREDALAAWAKAEGVQVATDPDVGATLDAPESVGLLITRIDASDGPDFTVWALGSEAGPAAAGAAIAAGAAAGVL